MNALLLKAGSIVVVYLFYFVIARLYGPEGNGLFSFCFTILNLLMIAALFGLDTYLVRYLPALHGRRDWHQIQKLYHSSLSLVVAISIILALVLYSVVTILASYNPALTAYHHGLQVTAITLIPATVVKFNAEAFRGIKAITLFSVLQNISILSLSLIAVVFLYYAIGQSITIIYALLMGETLVMTGSFYLIKKRLKSNIRLRWPRGQVSSILKAASPYLLTSTTFFLMNWTDKLMLGVLGSKAELGIYDVALKVSNLGIIIIFAINTIAAPKFSEFYSKEEIKRLQRFTHQTTLLITLFTLPILIIIYTFPSTILSLFGSVYTSGQFSLLVLVTGSFINAVSGSVIILLNMTGKQHVAQRILLTAGGFNLILNAILIPTMGMKGAAIATAITTLGWNLAGVAAIRYFYGFWTFQFTKLLTGRKG